MNDKDGKDEIRGEAASEATEGKSDISNAIDKLLANPELINMVASAIGKSAPVINEKSAPTEEKASGAPDVISAIAPVLSALKGVEGHREVSDRRSCLLVALKPYLCKERCEAIDYMIKLGKISELLKNMS